MKSPHNLGSNVQQRLLVTLLWCAAERITIQRVFFRATPFSNLFFTYIYNKIQLYIYIIEFCLLFKAAAALGQRIAITLVAFHSRMIWRY